MSLPSSRVAVFQLVRFFGLLAMRNPSDFEFSPEGTRQISKGNVVEKESSSLIVKSTHVLTTKWIVILSISLVTVIMIPILFTVIIPSIIVDSCENSDITIQKTTFLYPSDLNFQTSIDLKFSTGVSVDSKIDISSMKVTWDGIGGGNVMKLNDISRLKVTTSSQTMKANVHVTNLTALTDFANSIMTADTFDLKMNGNAVVTVIVPADVTLKKTSTLQGFSNWTTPAQIPSLNITGGTVNYLSTVSLATLSSSSNVEIIFGQTVYYRLNVWGNVQVGLGHFDNFTLFTGEFSDISTVFLSSSTPTEYNALMYLIGNYMSGVETPVTVSGLSLASPVSWLSSALSSVSIAATIPGMSAALVMYVDMYVNARSPLKVPFTLTLYNPLLVPVILDAMDASIYYKGRKIATVLSTGLNILIPSGGIVTSQDIPSQVDPKETQTVLDLLAAGSGLIDCYSKTTLYIVEFQAVVDYFQLNISAYVHPARAQTQEEGMRWREE